MRSSALADYFGYNQPSSLDMPNQPYPYDPANFRTPPYPPIPNPPDQYYDPRQQYSQDYVEPGGQVPTQPQTYEPAQPMEGYPVQPPPAGAQVGQRIVSALGNQFPPIPPSGVQGERAGAQEMVVPPTIMPPANTGAGAAPGPVAGPTPGAVPQSAMGMGAGEGGGYTTVTLPTSVVQTAQRALGALFSNQPVSPAVDVAQGAPGAPPTVSPNPQDPGQTPPTGPQPRVVAEQPQGTVSTPPYPKPTAGETQPATAPPVAAPHDEKPAATVNSETVNRGGTKEVPGARKKPQFSGTTGMAPSQTALPSPNEASEHPPVIEKPSISPQAYVNLEQTNKPLYDDITYVAARLHLSPWVLTNAITATTGADPNYNQNGHMGIAGITDDDAKRYETMFPQFFQEQNGQRIDIMDPVNNLMLGALKLQEMNKRFGENSNSALIAYRFGADAVNAMSRMSPQDQQAHYREHLDHLDAVKTGTPPSASGQPQVMASAIPGVPPGAPPPTATARPDTGLATAATKPPPEALAQTAPALGQTNDPNYQPAAQRTPVTSNPSQPSTTTSALQDQSAVNPAHGPSSTDQAHPPINGEGSGNAAGYFRAFNAAANTGNGQLALTYVSQHAWPGASMTDAWAKADASGTYAMLARGDVVGAQRWREFVFQTSHMAANQALMGAYQAMAIGEDKARSGADATGDYARAAQLIAKSYSAVPDGGQVTVQATRSGVWAQRYNEATGIPIGEPYQITAKGIAAGMNQTLDPQQFYKNLIEEQKANAEIAYKQGLLAYHNDANTVRREDNIRSNERAYDVAANAANMRNAQVALQSDVRLQTARSQDAMRLSQIESAFEKMYNPFGTGVLPNGQPNSTPQAVQSRSMAVDLANHGTDLAMSKAIGDDLSGTKQLYGVRPAAGGVGLVYQRSTGTTVGVLSPHTMQTLGMFAQPQPGPPGAPAAPAPPIGRTPAPPPNLAGQRT